MVRSAVSDVDRHERATKRRYADNASRWRAVKRRDKVADGFFYYAVSSTGVYCRPSCPARLARRENVTFHVSPESAERAGFRACKRCHPRDLHWHERHSHMIAAACRLLDDAEQEPSLEALARTAGMSRFHFHRLFKEHTGVTPRAYAAARRAERVRTGLKKQRSVTQAFHDAGYGTSRRFYESSTAILGMTPAAFRSGGKNARIHFAISSCTLGYALVAATDRGICAINLGDSPQSLVDDLHRDFPMAHISRASDTFEETVRRVVELIESPSTNLKPSLPLDVRGTSFQRRVWEALLAIPPGRTSSYSQIAIAIGAPTATRAVARACASNPIAVVIPCHRVLRRDGDIAGYRWGVTRKRTLLEREAIHGNAQSGDTPGPRASASDVSAVVDQTKQTRVK